MKNKKLLLINKNEIIQVIGDLINGNSKIQKDYEDKINFYKKKVIDDLLQESIDSLREYTNKLNNANSVISILEFIEDHIQNMKVYEGKVK